MKIQEVLLCPTCNTNTTLFREHYTPFHHYTITCTSCGLIRFWVECLDWSKWLVKGTSIRSQLIEVREKWSGEQKNDVEGVGGESWL